MRCMLTVSMIFLLGGCTQTSSYQVSSTGWDSFQYADPFVKPNYGPIRSLTPGIH